MKETAIEVKNLVKKFGEKTAVDDISFSIEKGQLFALLGVNGAGKTTTIRMLSELSKPTAGDAFILGNSIVTNGDEVKKIINLSPQETAVAPNLTVYENLLLMAEIYGLHKNEARQKTRQMIEQFTLEEVEKTKAKTLSGGWQRRLSIAMALISEPQVLFLDEPTLGLDVLARRELWHIVEQLKGKMTIILTTHYMEEAEALSDMVAIMVKGKIKACGTTEELKKTTGTNNLEEAFIAIAEGGEKDEN